MNPTWRRIVEEITKEAIAAVMPNAAVEHALQEKAFPGRVIMVAVGKAAWPMAHTAATCLKGQLKCGVVITKYGHCCGSIPGCEVYEAGHPVPDENSTIATDAALRAVEGLEPTDTVLFLLSGGGSALFEKPLIPLKELQHITGELMASGANIVEINTVRKRLSAVKGGRFALSCAPARVFSVVLSDIVGDPLPMIASGPTCPDPTWSVDALTVVKKYHISLSDEAMAFLNQETPKVLDNVETVITGSVRQLCQATADACHRQGFEPVILTDSLDGQAREVGLFLSAVARYHANWGQRRAWIVGGETVVRITGNGLGGRNQELALSAAAGIEGLGKVCIFSLGSDGTDGPTDAAGGIVDGSTRQILREKGIDIDSALDANDSYHALEMADGLLFTGPTGTNVNDVAVVLIDA